jgi:hypothetical protein
VVGYDEAALKLPVRRVVVSPVTGDDGFT